MNGRFLWSTYFLMYRLIFLFSIYFITAELYIRFKIVGRLFLCGGRLFNLCCGRFIDENLGVCKPNLIYCSILIWFTFISNLVYF